MLTVGRVGHLGLPEVLFLRLGCVCWKGDVSHHGWLLLGKVLTRHSYPYKVAWGVLPPPVPV